MNGARRLAEDIIAELRARGHQAYLVGGCVRDLLLGREPKDYDVATSAPPAVAIAMFPGADLVGAHFGVVLVRRGGHSVEVATFRGDLAYHDGRRPGAVVFLDDPRADMLRRDFTINAMMLDPVSGEVLDFTDGRGDLARGVVRAVGDPLVRFAEDHLRMLRAVRFAARFGFAVDPDTMTALRELAAHIRTVSAERVRDEITRILVEGGARRGFELLDESGLLAEVLPEVAAMKGVAQPPEFHPEGDVWTHTLLLLDGLREPALTLALGALLHDVGKPPSFRVADRIRFDGHAELGARMAEAILERLRYPREVIDTVTAHVASHMRFMDVRRMKASTLKRFLRGDRFSELLELHRIDCAASNGRLDNWEFARSKLAEIPPEELRPARLVTGDDLIAAGFTPGPVFGRMLEAVETAQLEGQVETREQALALALEKGRSGAESQPGDRPS